MNLKGPVEVEGNTKRWILETDKTIRCPYCSQPIKEGYYCRTFEEVRCIECEKKEIRKPTSSGWIKAPAYPCKADKSGHIHYRVIIQMPEQK